MLVQSRIDSIHEILQIRKLADMQKTMKTQKKILCSCLPDNAWLSIGVMVLDAFHQARNGLGLSRISDSSAMRFLSACKALSDSTSRASKASYCSAEGAFRFAFCHGCMSGAGTGAV